MYVSGQANPGHSEGAWLWGRGSTADRWASTARVSRGNGCSRGAVPPGSPTWAALAPRAPTYILPPSSRWRCSGPPSRPWPGGPRCAPRPSGRAPPPPNPQLQPRSARGVRARPGTPGGRARGVERLAAAPPSAAVPGGRTRGPAKTWVDVARRFPAHLDSIYGARETRPLFTRRPGGACQPTATCLEPASGAARNPGRAAGHPGTCSPAVGWADALYTHLRVPPKASARLGL